MATDKMSNPHHAKVGIKIARILARCGPCSSAKSRGAGSQDQKVTHRGYLLPRMRKADSQKIIGRGYLLFAFSSPNNLQWTEGGERRGMPGNVGISTMVSALKAPSWKFTQKISNCTPNCLSRNEHA